MNNSTSVSRLYAVAGDHHDGTYTCVVIRRDGHPVWGDQPLLARRWADIPAAATTRLARSGYRVTGEWAEVEQPAGGAIYGRAWQADIEVSATPPA